LVIRRRLVGRSSLVNLCRVMSDVERRTTIVL
jgi:hypothetical protein